LAVGILSANALDLTVSSLETNTDADAPADWFDVNLTVNGDGTVTFNFSNLVASGNGTKISTVYLGTDGGTPNDASDGFYSYFLNGQVDISYTGFAAYSVDWDPNGGNQIANSAGWSIQVEGDPKTGNDGSLINPNETLHLTFTLVDGTMVEQDLINAFINDPQQLGVAFHVQAITGGYSEWYEAAPGPEYGPVPDGGATLALMGLALVAFEGFRRKARL